MNERPPDARPDNAIAERAYKHLIIAWINGLCVALGNAPRSGVNEFINLAVFG